MNFDLTKPCADCPFRSDKYFHLTRGRRKEIADALTRRQQTFACHKTVDYSGESPRQHDKSQHCAGALIFLEAQGMSNQMMRIAERLSMYGHTKLDMTAPVYKTRAAFIGAKIAVEKDTL